MSLYLDLSEFLANPITTGIQRITGELCKHLPAGAITPIRLDGDRYIALRPDLVNAIGEYFAHGAASGSDKLRLMADVNGGATVNLSRQDLVLVAEVFENPQRLAFFRQKSAEELEAYRFIVFDMLPLAHPEYFWTDKLGLYGYFQLIRRAPHCAFISGDTGDFYYSRLRRSDVRGGVVLPLGCDSLGPRKKTPAINRPLAFSVIGTLEPRKNHHIILDAFETLLKEVSGLTLSFIGTMGWTTPEFERRIRALSSDPNSGFKFFSALGDTAIRQYVEESRATIYVSAAEGYGLPPVESLWAGTPVIASKSIPSLNGLRSSHGIHYVEPLNALHLREAVIAFLDDDYANGKTLETTELNLPTWRSFSDEVYRWCMT